MKTILVISAVVCFSLTLSAIELDDTFDEWDMIIKGCNNKTIEYVEDADEETLRIVSKARNGVELNCQEQIILIVEAQGLVRTLLEHNKTSNRKMDKEFIAWEMFEMDGRLKQLWDMDEESRTADEKAEMRIYLNRLKKALIKVYPDCFTP